MRGLNETIFHSHVTLETFDTRQSNTLHTRNNQTKTTPTMPTPPPSNNIPASTETGSDLSSNWHSRYRGVRPLTHPNPPNNKTTQTNTPTHAGRSRRPRPRPSPLNPPLHPPRPSPLLRLRARLHAPHSYLANEPRPTRLHQHPASPATPQRG